MQFCNINFKFFAKKYQRKILQKLSSAVRRIVKISSLTHIHSFSKKTSAKYPLLCSYLELSCLFFVRNTENFEMTSHLVVNKIALDSETFCHISWTFYLFQLCTYELTMYDVIFFTKIKKIRLPIKYLDCALLNCILIDFSSPLLCIFFTLLNKKLSFV